MTGMGWARCVGCGRYRWAEHRKGKPRRLRCMPCSAKDPKRIEGVRQGKLGALNPNWKGDAICRATGGGKARQLFPNLEPCVECGSSKSERHHIDGNPFHNSRSNIMWLCRHHHMKLDGRLVLRSSVSGQFVSAHAHSN